MRFRIATEADLSHILMEVPQTSRTLGFSAFAAAKVATACSELLRNVLKYASRGQASIRVLEADARTGIEFIVKDSGPGIDDVDRALQDHFSSSGTLGLGLPGVRRLMHEFEIETSSDGTRVRIVHWTK
jgi:serine/threonine-protein kinase RsbT